jgi:hypothetical protein
MGAVVGGLLLAGVLVIMVLAFTWQSWHRRRGDADALYVLDEAAAFAHARLSPEARARLSRSWVQHILEWQIEYQQVIAPRDGRPTVLGGGDAMEHVLERAAEQGVALEPLDVAEVMAADVEYLLAIGAVGAPATEEAS